MIAFHFLSRMIRQDAERIGPAYLPRVSPPLISSSSTRMGSLAGSLPQKKFRRELNSLP
jgi:hypothetical protein